MKDPQIQEWLLAVDGIATRLRELRGKRTGREMAEASGLRPAKVSKLELGQQIPTEDDIRRLAAAAGASESVADELAAKLEQMPTFRAAVERRTRFGQRALQERLNDHAERATLLRMFEMTQLPRPLQEIGYAESDIADRVKVQNADDEISEASALVLKSARLLYEPGRRFEVILAEPVLRWQVVPTGIMRTQLERLLQALSLPNLRLGILPLDAPLSTFPRGSFELYGDVGYVDTFHGPEEIASSRMDNYNMVMDLLWKDAIEGAKARRLIRAAIDRLPER